MKFSKVLIIVIIFLFFVTGGILGYNLGRNVEKKERLYGNESFRSFWAVVKTVDEEHKLILVSGIPENDINHRGESYLTISDKTVIMDSQPKKNIKLSDLKEGDSVRITYHGAVAYCGDIRTPVPELSGHLVGQ
ncbi:MAG TPA: hypothetical protein DDZ89_08135, partial [Clostridiales bacterium]|nr:hypothetical protein [Clostridiales bacterium]